MSNSSARGDGVNPESTQEVVYIVQRVVWENYCITAATTVFMYDFLLTFGREVDHIWRQKFTGATVLFILTRYVHFINAIVIILEITPWAGQSDKRCTVIYRIDQMLTIITIITAGAFCTLRVYAVWARSLKVLLVVGSCALVAPVIYLRCYIATIPSVFEPTGRCATDINMYLSTTQRLTHIARAFTVVTDLLVLVLTLMKTFRISKQAQRVKMMSPVVTVLLRDGTIYFAILVLLNILYIALAMRLKGFNPLPEFMDAFTAIVITRFLLDLRSIYYVDSCDGSITTRMSDAHFAPNVVMGNLGAPLEGRFGESPETQDDDLNVEFSRDPLATGIMGLTSNGTGREDDTIPRNHSQEYKDEEQGPVYD